MTVVHLHTHDEYSLLDGCGTAKQYAAQARKLEQPALAITNHGSIAGVIHHMNACAATGILPIPGCEVYYRHNRRVQGQVEHRYVYYHMTLLAKNATGWRNLMLMMSEAHDTGFYTKPCIDRELIDKYHEGIICGLGCFGSWMSHCVAQGDSNGATAWVRYLKDRFGDDLFAEIMPSSVEGQAERNLGVTSVANVEGVMIAATVDAHTPFPDWVDTQDVLLMINTNQTRKGRAEKKEAGEDVFEFNDKTFYLQSEDEIRANFAKNHPLLSPKVIDESIANTVEIASRITPFLIGRHQKMPKVDFPKSPIQMLRDAVYEGLHRLGVRQDQRYVDRVEFELAEIERRDVATYFMMVYKVVEWSMSDRGYPDANGVEHPGQKKPISVGPGRGSAAGCLVSYCLGITNLDPLPYNLYFERFLNPARAGLPDIDVDFPPDRVDEVEEYTKIVFGRDKVLDVIAHSTFGPRAAIRDVGRVLNVPGRAYGAATKTIDEQERAPLNELLVVNPALRRYKEEYPEAWLHATRLQGQVARRSEHAAALLATPDPVRETVPVERIGGMKGKLIAAFAERSGKGNALISYLNLVKFDWLRIAELTKQDYACELIKRHHGVDVVLNDLPIHRDPYATEPEVMKGFADGRLVGIFQFSATAQHLTKRLQPEHIFDLAAINALIRPGPRGAHMDQDYVERKHGRQPAEAWHSNLDPYLSYTLGLMVFQEQLIEVVHQLGGLSRPEADNFRKIASKLYRDPEYAREVMGEWYEPIKAGFMRFGFTEEAFGRPTGGGDDGTKPTGIWGKFLSFSDYSFNLSHAAGYAVLAYRDMWLKIHYPEEFYAALLSKGLSQIKEKRAKQKEQAVREARAIGLKVMPPDVNESGADYTVTRGGIRLGLTSIKDVGPVATKTILEERERGGWFKSFQEFSERVPAQQVNKTVKAALINGGAFDFQGLRDDLTNERIDEIEREVLGISLSSAYSVNNYGDVLDPRIHTEAEFTAMHEGDRVQIGGEITDITEHIDTKGNTMAFITVAYGNDEWSCTFFSKMYKTYHDLLHSRRPVIILGNKNTYNGRSGINVSQAMDVDELAHMVRDQQSVAA